MVWRDGDGRALGDFPRPSLAVDVAVLTLLADDDGRPHLAVALQQRAGDHAHGAWALPGTFVREGERLGEAVARAAGRIGLPVRAPRQLHAFDDPARDDRGHVVSVAHVDVVPALTSAADGRWRVVAVEGDRVRPPDGQERLPFDHDLVVREALAWARRRYRRRPDPSGLLREPFSLRELQRVHEAVLGERLVKDTFRRRVEPLLLETDERSSGVRGPRARLFRRRP